ncbi:hypothetical protein MASR2M78_05600 [Treponema sp.]
MGGGNDTAHLYMMRSRSLLLPISFLLMASLYIDIAVPIDVLEPSDYLYSLLSRAAVSSGFSGMDCGEVSSLLARTAGFHALLSGSSAVPGLHALFSFPRGQSTL